MLSHLLPLYLKKAYHDDPLHECPCGRITFITIDRRKLSENMKSKVIVPGIKPKDVELLKSPPR